MPSSKVPRCLPACLFLTTVVSAVALIGTARAQAEGPDRRVYVSGEGILREAPDQATVRFGVVTIEADPEEARRLNAEAAAAAMNAVRAMGVDERKIRLETLRIQPYREFNPDTRRYEDKGFEAVREVVVTLEELEKLPALIAEVVQQGANRLSGITYDLRERTRVRNEALRLAVLNAREKAALMAEALGATLGEVVEIREEMVSFPRPVVRMQGEVALAKADAAPEPDAYASGEIEVRAVVQVTFALK